MGVISTRVSASRDRPPAAETREYLHLALRAYQRKVMEMVGQVEGEGGERWGGERWGAKQQKYTSHTVLERILAVIVSKAPCHLNHGLAVCGPCQGGEWGLHSCPAAMPHQGMSPQRKQKTPIAEAIQICTDLQRKQ